MTSLRGAGWALNSPFCAQAEGSALYTGSLACPADRQARSITKRKLGTRVLSTVRGMYNDQGRFIFGGAQRINKKERSRAFPTPTLGLQDLAIQAQPYKNESRG